MIFGSRLCEAMVVAPMVVAAMVVAAMTTALSATARAQCPPEALLPQAPTNHVVGGGGDISGDTIMLAGGTPGLGIDLNLDEVYVYQRQGGQWIQTQTIPAPVPSGHFGRDIHIDGTDAIIGDDQAIHFFEEQAGSWVPVGSFVDPDPVVLSSSFGHLVRMVNGVAMTGNAWVGSAVEGKIHIWEKVGGAWVYTQAMNPVSAEDYFFGDSFDLIQGRLVAVVSADPPGSLAVSYIQTFEPGPNGWVMVASQLAPPEVAPLDNFGSSVALSGNRLVVGADRTNVTSPQGVLYPDQGMVYVFELNPTTNVWALETTLMESNEQYVTGDQFGRYVDIEGDRIVVGEWESAGNNDGGIEVFERIAGTWVEAGTLGNFAGFRMTLRLEGEEVLVAEPMDASRGVVYSGRSGVDVAYGTGCPGTHQLVPHLSMDGCIVAGSSPTLRLTEGILGAAPVLFVSGSPASLPIGGGCEFLVGPAIPLALPPFTGSAQLGNVLELPISLPASLAATQLYLQAFTPDAVSAINYAASNGLMVRIDA